MQGAYARQSILGFCRNVRTSAEAYVHTSYVYCPSCISMFGAYVSYGTQQSLRSREAFGTRTEKIWDQIPRNPWKGVSLVIQNLPSLKTSMTIKFKINFFRDDQIEDPSHQFESSSWLGLLSSWRQVFSGERYRRVPPRFVARTSVVLARYWALQL